MLNKVIKAQGEDEKLESMHSLITAGKKIEGWSIHSNGGIYFMNRLYVPNNAMMKEEVMREAHYS